MLSEWGCQNTPFGLPVVPDEYSMGAPKHSSSIGVSGHSSNNPVNASKPSISPPTERQRTNPAALRDASDATVERLEDAMKTLA